MPAATVNDRQTELNPASKGAGFIIYFREGVVVPVLGCTFVGMKHLGLFEGIGGFSLAARWAGWETLAWCEWNEFGQRVLRHHFPNAEGHGDITQTDFTIYRGRVDIITGGFPCQPYSTAGKRLGKEDDRHLWPEMLRAIREVRPRWVVGENVLGLVNWSGGLVFHEVQADLEAEGYQVSAYVLPSGGINAPHKRDRVWVVAYSDSIGQQGGDEGMFQAQQHGHDKTSMLDGKLRRSEWTNGLPRPRIFRDDDGLSQRLVDITLPKWRNESIKAYGNAIVPQVALQIFNAINEFEAK